MKTKKLMTTLAASALLAAALTACGGETEAKFAPVAKEDLKVGLITLHDESSTYDKNFIDSMKRAASNLGLRDDQVLLATGIEEKAECKDKAIEFATKGCNVVFADSFGHEDYMIQAAKAKKNVRFCHATGTKAHTVKLDNYSNAFASIYEGRYLAGIAAGMKLNAMKEAGSLKGETPKMGYVGAFPYAEVKSGYTAFYLGAKSVCEDVTMEVRFTSSWYDFTKEKETANALIQGGCDLISQHADSYGAPEACEAAGVPNVTYNGTTESVAPNTYLISSKIDWTPYFEYMINCVINGEKIDTDWTGTLANGAVKLDAVGAKAGVPGIQEAIDAAKAKFAAGTLHVFDTNTFTVGGKKLDSYLADVDDFGDFQPETEVVKDGYFHESEYRSAPYFDVNIDGITIVE